MMAVVVVVFTWALELPYFSLGYLEHLDWPILNANFLALMDALFVLEHFTSMHLDSCLEVLCVTLLLIKKMQVCIYFEFDLDFRLSFQFSSSHLLVHHCLLIFLLNLFGWKLLLIKQIQKPLSLFPIVLCKSCAQMFAPFIIEEETKLKKESKCSRAKARKLWFAEWLRFIVGLHSYTFVTLNESYVRWQ